MHLLCGRGRVRIVVAVADIDRSVVAGVVDDDDDDVAVDFFAGPFSAS